MARFQSARVSRDAQVARSPLLRAGEYFALAILVGSLVLIQVLIGGRGQLFALPSYFFLACGALLALLVARQRSFNADALCLTSAGAFFAYLIVRAICSPVPYFARADLYSAVASVTLYLLVATVLSRSSRRMAIIIPLILFAAVHVFVGLIQFMRGDNFMLFSVLQRADYGPRASGFYVCPNHLAGLLEVLGLFGLSITIWSRLPTWAKLIVGYFTAICFFGLAITGSRGGYLSILFGLAIFAALSVWTVRSASSRLTLRFTGIACVIVAAVIAGGVMIQHDTFLRSRAGNVGDKQNMRLQLWQAAIQQWKLEPVLGTGSGTYRFYGRQFRSPKVQNDPIDVHNDYLQLLSEYGVVGFVGFLAFFALHIRRGLTSFNDFRRDLGRRGSQASNRFALNLGALASVAAYLVHSAVDFNLHIPANALLLAFVFGVLANPDWAVRSEPMPDATRLLPRFAIVALSVALLLQAIRLIPGEFYAEEARVALRDEDPVAAIGFTDEAMRHERGNPLIFFYKGRALAALANRTENTIPDRSSYQKAVSAFEAARALAPLDSTYSLELAYVYDQLGRFSDAESMYSLAKQQDPHSRNIAELYAYHRNKVAAQDAPRAEPSQPEPGRTKLR